MLHLFMYKSAHFFLAAGKMRVVSVKESRTILWEESLQETCNPNTRQFWCPFSIPSRGPTEVPLMTGLTCIFQLHIRTHLKPCYLALTLQTSHLIEKLSCNMASYINEFRRCLVLVFWFGTDSLHLSSLPNMVFAVKVLVYLCFSV